MFGRWNLIMMNGYDYDGSVDDRLHGFLICCMYLVRFVSIFLSRGRARWVCPRGQFFGGHEDTVDRETPRITFGVWRVDDALSCPRDWRCKSVLF